MCGTEGDNDRVGFGLLIRDSFYATENILHVRGFDSSTLESTNLASGDGMNAERCRTLNVNKDSFIHSPGFSWKTFAPSQSIRKDQYELWVYQYPLDNCVGMTGVSCEEGKDSIITQSESDLYMAQTIRLTFQCDNEPGLADLEPTPTPSPFLKEASRDLRNAWWDAFLSYIRIQSENGVDVSFQIVNTVRGAFHDMIMGDKEEFPMGCLSRIGQSDTATRPFMDLKAGVALEQVTLEHPDSLNKLLSNADQSVILGAMAIDWTTQRAQNSYDWNENDNLLHKIRVGRPEVDTTLCLSNQDTLEDHLPQLEVEIEDFQTGELRPLDPDEPLFHPNELASVRAGVQTRKGRMTAAHEEFKRAMLVGDLNMRDAVALMGGHGLGFIRLLAEWAPLNSENDCDDLRAGPWTTQPHVLDNEYFTILQDLLEVAESNMDAWTELAPASTLWDARDAINWIFRCGEDMPKIPVDTAKELVGSQDRFSSVDPTVTDGEELFASNLQMLDADLGLIFADDTVEFVREFAAREISFLDAFHTAYIKLSEHNREELISYTHPDGVPGDLLERNPAPTRMPTTTDPSFAPSRTPSSAPSPSEPTNLPTTDEPTNLPTTEEPTYRPTVSSPSRQPNKSPSPPPTPEPTRVPTTDEPSFSPSSSIPSFPPSKGPTTDTPTFRPSPLIPPYPYSVSRWARFGDMATCQFQYQGTDYRIGSGSYSSLSACQTSCEENTDCLSVLYRSYSSCTLYNKIPSSTSSYTHGGKFSCWTYDGGKGVQPLYHWMGWGDCYSQYGASLSFDQSITTTSFESCMQHCRNENCLSVTWIFGSNLCRLHRQYAPRSQYYQQKHSTYAQCYNILYN